MFNNFVGFVWLQVLNMIPSLTSQISRWKSDLPLRCATYVVVYL